jgi:hypothetical protein
MSPLDCEPKRIELSTEEQWFCYRVLRGRLRRADEDEIFESRPVAAALGKVEAGVSSFTAREARRVKEAVVDYARDPSVSLAELALSMVVLERIETAFDLPDQEYH